jgi:transcriptional regulator with XRE-family HTH domain
MPTRKKAPPRLSAAPAARPPEGAVLAVARQLRGWADTLIHVAGSATDIGLNLAQARLKDPAKKTAVAKAGRQLRQWREAAGLTLEEVSSAVGLGDADVMAQAEGGIIALPFDVVLRLAGVLGRRDPLPVVMALTRQYNPDLWRTLEGLGVGKLVVQGARERELANIYRGSDAARALDDASFAAVLAFTQQAFDMAVAFKAAAIAAADSAHAAAPADKPAPADREQRAAKAARAGKEAAQPASG